MADVDAGHGGHGGRVKLFLVAVYSIAEDGLPDMDDLVGEVSFIFDGCVVSGWPLQKTDGDGDTLWEANSDVGNGRRFSGVTHWVRLPRTRDLIT